MNQHVWLQRALLLSKSYKRVKYIYISKLVVMDFLLRRHQMTTKRYHHTKRDELNYITKTQRECFIYSLAAVYWSGPIVLESVQFLFVWPVDRNT